MLQKRNCLLGNLKAQLNRLAGLIDACWFLIKMHQPLDLKKKKKRIYK